jgi:hypothetical protein
MIIHTKINQDQPDISHDQVMPHDLNRTISEMYLDTIKTSNVTTTLLVSSESNIHAT